MRLSEQHSKLRVEKLTITSDHFVSNRWLNFFSFNIYADL